MTTRFPYPGDRLVTLALRRIHMSDDVNPPVRIPESEDDAVRMVEEDMEDDEELDEQKRNLIRAQYRLIM